MNCLQFDDLVQELLDQRLDPRLNKRVIDHSGQCDQCRRSLACYTVMQEFYSPQFVVPSSPKVHASQHNRSAPLQVKSHSHSVGRSWKLASVLAAMLLIFAGLYFFQDSQGARFSPVARNGTESGHTAGLEQMAGAALPSRSAFDGLLVARLLPSRMPEWSDFSLDSLSLEHIDLVALVPERPVTTVRRIPATLQTIAPIYEYSSGIPLVNTWTSSVNYTLQLLKSNWKRQPEPAPPEPGDDFGRAREPMSSLLFA